MSGAAFAPGSISFRLYPHDLPATELVAVMREQAAHANAVGFDGVMTSEHHGGFAGYLPNPIQAAGWALEAMADAWAAPCPLLLPLRAPALVIEEIAWLAARFPDRVGLGVAAGSLEQDFTIMGLDKIDLTGRFAASLATVASALQGRDSGALAGDPAVHRCADRPVPMLSAAMSPTACRRAAAHGVGLLIDSLAPAARCRELAEVYRSAGGTGPVALVRRIAVGAEVAERHAQQEDVYRSYAATAAQEHWQQSELIAGTAAQVAERLAAVKAAADADSLNLRVHVPGITPDEVKNQLDRLGDVVAQLRS